MTELAHLSEDVLEAILDCVDVVAPLLWFAGNRLLNSKMARCCPLFNASLYLGSNRLGEWPRLISEFTSLKRLSIRVYEISAPINEVAASFKQLPPTLTAIYLTFKGASTLPFVNPAEERFYHLDPAQPTEYYSADCWSFEEKFPRLKQLTLAEPTELLNFCFSTSSFGIFPQSLEHLCWSGHIVPMTLFSLLPSDLKWLDFCFESQLSLSPAQASSLPRGLVHLDYVTVSDEDAIARLPRSLMSGFFLPSPSTLSPSLLSALPPSLEILYGMFEISFQEFEAIGRPWTSFLPKNMTQLSVGVHPFNPSEIAHLPPALREIISLNLNWFSFDRVFNSEGAEVIQKSWPSNLTSVQLSGLLPANYLLNYFPPTLKELTGFTVGHRDDFFTDTSVGFPPSLEHLQLYCMSSSALKITAVLPLPMKVFNLQGTALSPSSFSMLPRDLVTLLIPNTTVSESEDCMSQLPPTITKLLMAGLPASSFSILPRSLTELKTYNISGTVTDDVMSQLPTSMKRVELCDRAYRFPNIKSTSGLLRFR